MPCLASAGPFDNLKGSLSLSSNSSHLLILLIPLESGHISRLWSAYQRALDYSVGARWSYGAFRKRAHLPAIVCSSTTSTTPSGHRPPCSSRPGSRSMAPSTPQFLRKRTTSNLSLSSSKFRSSVVSLTSRASEIGCTPTSLHHPLRPPLVALRLHHSVGRAQARPSQVYRRSTSSVVRRYKRPSVPSEPLPTSILTSALPTKVQPRRISPWNDPPALRPLLNCLLVSHPRLLHPYSSRLGLVLPPRRHR